MQKRYWGPALGAVVVFGYWWFTEAPKKLSRLGEKIDAYQEQRRETDAARKSGGI